MLIMRAKNQPLPHPFESDNITFKNKHRREHRREIALS